MIKIYNMYTHCVSKFLRKYSVLLLTFKLSQTDVLKLNMCHTWPALWSLIESVELFDTLQRQTS